jgi:transglutaminase-like putative cysteine protease
VFNIGVVHNQYQQVEQEKLEIYPRLEIEDYNNLFNGNRYLRLNAPKCQMEISYQALVELHHFLQDPQEVQEVTPADLPLEILPLLLPSRYCQSDQLINLAFSEFGHLTPGYSRVTAICNWICQKVIYLSGSSDHHTSAYDTATERVGVCRDFAHLAIAFCRALNIPARFVTSYAYGLNPPDFHACFEAYLGDRWYLFDPTRLVPETSIIRIGTGRDAADVSFATIFGMVEMNEMRLWMQPLPDPNTGKVDLPCFTTEAISIS